jgi:hypothetical protein
VLENQIAIFPASDNKAVLTQTALLSCIASPVLLLDPDGLIVNLNTAANDLLRNHLDLRRSNARLESRQHTQTVLLAGIIARVSRTQQSEPLCLFSETGVASLILNITAVPDEDLLMVRIADLQPAAPNHTEFLARALGLTPECAHLAESLMHGSSLTAYAAKAGVTLRVARLRMKQLLDRTGSPSQTALISTLWQISVFAPELMGGKSLT